MSGPVIPSNGHPFGPQPWLVLGGGGLKGLGHIGAWRAMLEAGIRPAGIVGTSIGALVGCCLAGGMASADLEQVARALTRGDIIRVNRRVVWVNGIRQPSVFRGDVLRDYVERVLPVSGWDALEIPVQVNAVSLGTGHTAWFGPGGRTDVDMVDAVLASASLPVLYPPVPLGDDLYVDGGTLDMLGLDRAVEMGATGIVAVDTGTGGEEDPEAVVAQGLVGVHQRVFGIMSGRRRRQKVESWNRCPVATVRPELDGYTTFDFDAIPYFIEAGYQATRDALAEGVPS